MNYKDKIILLSKDEGNTNCFDCDHINPQWASINNGIYICLSCAGKHRNLGVNISKIKSVNLDIWSYEEYLLMKNTGNKRLKAFMESADINLNEKIEVKYKYKIIQFYRDLIKAEIEGTNFPKEIPKNKEKETIQEIIKNDIQIERINNDHIISNCPSSPNKKEKKSLLKGIKNFFEKEVKKIKNKSDDLFNDKNIAENKIESPVTNIKNPSDGEKLIKKENNISSFTEYKIEKDITNYYNQENQFKIMPILNKTQDQMNVHLFLAKNYHNEEDNK